MGMGMPVRVDLAIAVAVMAGRDRIEVDAGLLDGGLGLGTIALGIVSRDPSPGFHGTRTPRAPARPALMAPRARYACILRV